jgi:hypothetical protein
MHLAQAKVLAHVAHWISIRSRPGEDPKMDMGKPKIGTDRFRYTSFKQLDSVLMFAAGFESETSRSAPAAPAAG